MEKETFTFRNTVQKTSGDDILRLLRSREDELFSNADAVRREYCGDSIYVRGLLEFSNYCCRNCLYCGLRAGNRRLKRYRISPPEIIETALGAKEKGIKTIVLQSGDDFWYTADVIADTIGAIKKGSDIAVTLSVGERPPEDYRIWKRAGADRYLLKHETVNPGLYEKLHPGQTLGRRIEILEQLAELGYQIGAGCIVGLPGQALEDLAEDILLMKRLDVDMAGIGPFIPHPDTPLGNSRRGRLGDALRVLAAARIVLKDAHLPATTATATIHQCGYEKAFAAGANVVMADITPGKYRSMYEIYPGKGCDDREILDDLSQSFAMIESVGRTVCLDRGDSLKWKRHQKDYVSI